MPYMTNGKRDYKKQRAYDSKPDVKADRAARNRARLKVKNSGVDVRGKDVDHKTPIGKGGTNARSNLRAVSPKKNRSFARTKSGKMK